MNNPEIFKTTITAISHEGRGIASISGKTTFLQGGLIGEEVEFVYSKKRNKWDEGQVVQVLKASPCRALPRCGHYGICGGCSLQHINEAMQLQLKQTAMLEQLAHFGHLKPDVILPPLSGPMWGYRRKARLGVKFVNKKNKLLVGFRERNSAYLADIRQCHVLHPGVGFKLDILAQLIADLQSYQTIPQVEVAVGEEQVALIIRHLQPLCDSDLEKLRDFAVLHHCHLYLQPGGMETIHRLHPEGETPIYLKYALKKHEIEFLFHPTDFVQVNAEINEKMVDLALELLNPQHNDNVLDLFCGLGNFSLPLARYCHAVTGIEGDQSMVDRAYQNAAHNAINNVHFYTANLFKIDELAFSWMHQKYDKILIDPPRAGALALMPLMHKFQAKCIVYISCNPATLARDAGILVQQGDYRLAKVGVINMFGHTQHIESIAVFEKI